MTTVSQSTKPVSATIGDTLSDKDKNELHEAAEENIAGSNATHSSTIDEQLVSNFKEGAQTLEAFVKSHPYQSAGIAALGGALLYTLFKR
ncbi:hypothetical protein ACOI22_01160 [Glaciecola sp. 2405UD65-10]|uniref:hypothetical protein n=1 Tax=Glaciecola sp. 2405UD65-10 TaxID=3397244 RepID=UPI003B5A226D